MALNLFISRTIIDNTYCTFLSISTVSCSTIGQFIILSWDISAKTPWNWTQLLERYKGKRIKQMCAYNWASWTYVPTTQPVCVLFLYHTHKPLKFAFVRFHLKYFSWNKLSPPEPNKITLVTMDTVFTSTSLNHPVSTDNCRSM